MLNGTPRSVGNFTVVVLVTESFGNVLTKSYAVTIANAVAAEAAATIRETNVAVDPLAHRVVSVWCKPGAQAAATHYTFEGCSLRIRLHT